MFEYDEFYEQEPSIADEILIQAKDSLVTAIIESVNGEIAEIISENKRIRDTNKKLTEEKREVDIQRKKLEDDILTFNKNKERIISDANKDYIRSIASATLTDKIYIVKSTAETKICGYCEGKHRVEIAVFDKTVKVDCPHCGYDGKIVTKKTYYPEKRIVNQVNIKVYGQTTEIHFWTDNETGRDSREQSVKDFYFTLEECQKECDRLNKDK
jgi:hypothetical protein